MIIRLTVAASVLAIVSGCQVGPSLEERENAYQALTLDHWQEATKVVDDPLNPTIEISTFQGHKDQIFSFALKNDQFLRAMVDRKTGKATIQGYVTSEDPHDWLSPTMVGFADVIDTRPVTTVDFDAYACGGGNCQHYEEIVFDLGRQDIQTLIDHAEETGARFVRFRIQGQTGRDRDGRFHVNEMRAILAAVDNSAG